MRNIPYLFWIFLLVNGVSGVEELPLIVGDSVTLKSAEIPSNKKIQWLFGKTRLAEIKGNSEDPKYYDVKDFKYQLDLDKNTGYLTINNISTEHSGEYTQNIEEIPRTTTRLHITDGVRNVQVMKGDAVTLRTGFTRIDGVNWKFGNQDLKPTDDQTGDLTINITANSLRENYVLEIKNSRMGLQRTYHLLTGEKPRVSVKKGESVFLSTGVNNIHAYDLMLWNFKGRTIAEINKRGNSVNDSRDGRLQMNDKSGSLIISNSATTDAGDYNLIINSSTQSLQRTISVTVSNSGVSPGAEAGIIVGLLVFLWCLQL